LGEHARREARAVVATITAVGIAACGGGADSMSSDSIVDPERAPNPLLANSSFEEGALPPWQIAGRKYASVGVTRRLSWEGQYSVRVRARGTRVRGSVLIGQIARMTQAARGSRYRLVLRARTRRLNRPIQVEIKLIYDHDSFDFVPGRAVAGSPGLPNSRVGIPPGTWRRWITVKADAVAKRRVRGIHIFAFDSGPGLLRGTVWIDSVELSTVAPREA
jgi:hypothetical protein